MATESWPAFLPQFPIDNPYTLTLATGVIRTSMESGIARQRRRFEGAPSTLSPVWEMTGDQADLFKSWLEHKAAFGAAYFNISLILDNVPTEVEARIIGQPSFTYVAHDAWHVSVPLEVFDPPPLSGEALDIVIDIGFDALTAMQTAVNDGQPFFEPFFDDWQRRFPAP